MRPGWLGVCAQAAFVVVGTVHAAQPPAAMPADPASLLIRAADSAKNQTFQGIVIYRDEDRLESLRVVHRYQNGHESERVTSLNGEPREIFREDNKVWCILPKDHMLLMERPTLKGILSQLTPERVHALAPLYDFRSLGSERVAGRDCVGVGVVPRDNLRYGYEVWADKDTGLPLRISLVDKDDKIIEQMMFTEVDFPASIPDDAFETDLNTAKFKLIPRELPDTPPPLLPVPGGDPDWSFDKLPEGFRVVMHDERKLPDGSGIVSHTLLTDGLSAISVFKDNGAEARKHFRGLSHMGSVQAYSRMVGNYHVTVVGEAPVVTIRMIGDGLRYIGPETPPAAADPESDH